MPLLWKREQNPYRNHCFALLQVGPNASRGVILAARKKIVAQLHRGAQHVVAGRQVTEAEILEAESRLLDDRGWAEELLLAHAAPSGNRLQQLCRQVVEQATPQPTERRLRLVRLSGLAPLLPVPGPNDVEWPDWEEFGLPGPRSETDRQLDIQFDL
jgi:hypothetical protein